MEWIREPVRRFLCGLGGHELMRSYSPGRVCLKCLTCSYETPGWTLKEPRPRARRRRALYVMQAFRPASRQT